MIVHLNVVAEPTVNPVTTVVGDAIAEIVPVPETILHAPVPLVAVFAVS